MVSKIYTQFSHISGSLVAGVAYSFISLEDISIQVEEEFGEILKRCSAEVTDLCKRKKQAWQKADDLEGKCQRLCQAVKIRPKTWCVACFANTLEKS